MGSFGKSIELDKLENNLVLPDLWQQKAVAALREGKDIVIHAPTGAGKTLVFELWAQNGKPKKRAIYTVPTRALANDKMAEWKARGWNVGIATGDLSINLDAPILVATLETQKNRLITGFGPDLLVIDEYQMIGDRDRGLNYELSLSLCPQRTQLLLMSGSVANPKDVVAWLRRLGRPAELIEHHTRPVPLEEVNPIHFQNAIPNFIQGHWPRMITGALAEDLGPVLIFAPQRKNAEKLAKELASQIPTPFPLSLTPEQKKLVGPNLASLLENRIAYHHSGLSYAARAGVIEPLAKKGQLRAVVATMGLAAGINFSLRSVALAGTSYKRDYADHRLEPNELLQMFGRAGRRGIDETGYVITTPNSFSLGDGYPGKLKRSAIVDWAALINIMTTASRMSKNPFYEAVRVQQRLFTTKPILLGVEFCLSFPDAPCKLQTDAERARLSQKSQTEMLNSNGQWEPLTQLKNLPANSVIFLKKISKEKSNLLKSIQGGSQRLFEKSEREKASDIRDARPDVDISKIELSWLKAESAPHIIHPVSKGPWIDFLKEDGEKIVAKKMIIADQLHSGNFVMIRAIKKLIKAQRKEVAPDIWYQECIPEIKEKFERMERTPVLKIYQEGYKVYAILSLSNSFIPAHTDSYGANLWNPLTRDVTHLSCGSCPKIEICQSLDKSPGVAYTWKKLGLINDDGSPTLTGQIMSFFPQGSGLAIAAALFDDSYELQDLIFDVANLDAGFRFSGDEGDRWSGRLAFICKKAYSNVSVNGYLVNGVPPNYGNGASQIVYSIHTGETDKSSWLSPNLGVGDIDRMIIEWRSLLRQIANAPDLPFEKWTEFKSIALTFFKKSESPTQTELPELDFLQTQRISHALDFRDLRK